MTYEITVARTGTAVVQAESKEDAIAMASCLTCENIRWDDDWAVTDCQPSDCPVGIFED